VSVEITDEAVDAFEDVFYAEIPQDAIRPLRAALEAAAHAILESRVEAVARTIYGWYRRAGDPTWSTLVEERIKVEFRAAARKALGLGERS
jgi:hypothetical protein